MTSCFNNSYSPRKVSKSLKSKENLSSESEPMQFVEAGILNIFSYDNNNLKTNVSILGRKYNYKMKIKHSDERGATYQHHVKFTFCGVQLDDSYSALNSVFSTIKVFEKHKFGAGSKSITVKITGVKYDNLYAMCRIVNSSQGHELLEIGLCQKKEKGDTTLMQTMHIGYVYAFQNALLKAMNWICPMQGAEHSINSA